MTANLTSKDSHDQLHNSTSLLTMLALCLVLSSTYYAKIILPGPINYQKASSDHGMIVRACNILFP